MDSLITAAARALTVGDALGALNRVALRDDAPALALRGVAMAQLGDLKRAKVLLRRAARGFGPNESVARARCVVAEAEIALVSRELWRPTKTLESARATLEAHGDRINAAYAQYLELRRLVLVGRLDLAEQVLPTLDPSRFPPALRTAHELIVAGIAIRRIQIKAARAALSRAAFAARHARIPALMAEVERARLALDAPAARLIAKGEGRLVGLDEVEELVLSKAFVVDACRYLVRQHREAISLARRPVLFKIARTLAEAWPDDVARESLIQRAFGGRHADESHRARLRVEIARLRGVLRRVARITATPQGFALSVRRAREVVVLAPPIEDDHASLLAFLADGEAWSSSALALALGASQRSVQRALEALASTSQVQSLGRGRARRWTMPPTIGFTTPLLLPAPLLFG
jgi:hypothetical protein